MTACRDKTRHATQGKALVAAVRAARRGDRLRVYRCPICKGWHLTSQEKRA